MLRRTALLAVTACLAACTDRGSAETRADDAAVLAAAEPRSVFDERREDWRVGPVTYQIFVDRFAPSLDLEAKRHLYEHPRSLQPWDALPVQGEPAPGTGVWTHELAFWGGDLDSVRDRTGYLRDLGVDVVYLNPIQLAPTNHKYDAIDYLQISPEYGTFEDLQALSDTLHDADMRLVLDGVFNHVGSRSTWFLDAQASEDSPYRDWFHFDPDVQNGYVGWWGVHNLPELNWENEALRARMVGDADAVVRHWFDYGIDGWRLDVATELGYANLAEITAAAHETRPGSLVIGEVWSYPARWTGVMDAVMNFPLREMMFNLVEGDVSGPVFAASLDRMITDADLDPLLRSWILLDNHDTPRLATLYPEPEDRAFLQTLQFTLPGAPLVYYGVEAGMEGGHDPGSRGAMVWENARTGNPEFDRIARLIELRATSPALRIGEFVPLDSENLLAFLRLTDRSAETVLVIANNTREPVTETLLLRDGSLMSGDVFEDALTGETFGTQSAVIEISIPARAVRVLRPQRWAEHTRRTGHSPYRNVP